MGRIHYRPNGDVDATRSMDPISSPAGAPARSLLSLLAEGAGRNAALPLLHQQALPSRAAAVRCCSSTTRATGHLHATSGSGIDALPTGPWHPDGSRGHARRPLVRSRRAHIRFAIVAHQMPDLPQRLDARRVLLVPLVRARRAWGLLAVGFTDRRVPAPSLVAQRRHRPLSCRRSNSFASRQREELQRDIRELLDDFLRAVSKSRSTSPPARAVCSPQPAVSRAIARLSGFTIGASRQLVLQASSDVAYRARRRCRCTVGRSGRVRAAVATAQSRAGFADRSRAMRQHVSQCRCAAAAARSARSSSRACASRPAARLDLDRADELGRQLSSAVENMQLLDDVMRSRRELENTSTRSRIWSSCRSHGSIVHVNQAFAARVGGTRSAARSPARQLLGPELAGWLGGLEQPRCRRTGSHGDVTDSVLSGPFMVTVTDLRSERPGVGTRDRRARPSAPERSRPSARSCEAADAVGETRGARPVRRRHRARAEQPAAGRPRPPRAAARDRRVSRSSCAQEVQTIYREADRAAKIVRNLLVFAGSRRLRAARSA